jgi:membrane protease subunit HflK
MEAAAALGVAAAMEVETIRDHGARVRNRHGGGGNPPDLEELIRRGQDKLRQALPGGGGPGAGGGKLIALVVASVWSVSG